MSEDAQFYGEFEEEYLRELTLLRLGLNPAPRLFSREISLECEEISITAALIQLDELLAEGDL